MRENLTTSPVCGAWIIQPAPTYRATWGIVAGSLVLVAQKSRSPGSSSASPGWLPTPHCSREVLGSETPAAAYAHRVSPLQSKVLGPLPAYWYGFLRAVWG